MLEFIVISYNLNCEEYSQNLVSNLNKCKNICAKLDINYNQSIINRQNAYKKEEKDIIIIDNVCIVNNEVIVKYSDKGSKAKRYNKDEFIDLLESFENNLNDDNTKDTNDENNKDDNSTCLIM